LQTATNAPPDARQRVPTIVEDVVKSAQAAAVLVLVY
jgi:hypothetical protein